MTTSDTGLAVIDKVPEDFIDDAVVRGGLGVVEDGLELREMTRPVRPTPWQTPLGRAQPRSAVRRATPPARPLARPAH